MTQYGPLVTRDADGVPIAAVQDINQVCLTAELIFESVVMDEDYHKCMNGEIYMKWLKNRLIPTFAHLYPTKKMSFSIR